MRAELLGAVQDWMRQRGLLSNSMLSEQLLKGYLSLNMQSEFHSLLREAESREDVTPGITIMGLRAALASSDFDVAMAKVKRLAVCWQLDSPSTASLNLLRQFVGLAYDQGTIFTVLKELHEHEVVLGVVFDAALAICAKKWNTKVLKAIEQFGREKEIKFTSDSYCALIQGSATAGQALDLFREAVELDFVTKALLLAVISAAITHKDEALASLVLDNLPNNPVPQVAVGVLFLASNGLLMTDQDPMLVVLHLYETKFADLDASVDPKAAKILVEAALCHHRVDLLGRLMESSPDTTWQAKLLSRFAFDNSLTDTIRLFRACKVYSATTYSVLLKKCIACHDTKAATQFMSEAVAAGMATYATHNAMMKMHYLDGNFKEAHAVIAQIQAAGGAPDLMTFHEMLNATIKDDLQSAWKFIDEMKSCGLQPNCITCSIMLKSIVPGSSAEQAERILSFSGNTDDVVDETMLCSIVESCIRAGLSGLLARQLRMHSEKSYRLLNSAQAFGSMIRAYGFVKDLEGVRYMWTLMLQRHIVPETITLGCMLEALVNSGDSEIGYTFLQEVWADEQMRKLTNSVVYGSVLRGFTLENNFPRVWAVQLEMRQRGIEFTLVTYNMLLYACAQCGEMRRVPAILTQMVGEQVEPALATYCSIIKGYCREHKLDNAFEVLEELKLTPHFKPDDILYNTLLSGCAQMGLYDRGIRVYEEMLQAGVTPSGHTLSLLVKLASRGGRFEKAFEFCDEFSRKFNLRANVFVHNNLLLACLDHKGVHCALEAMEKMLDSKVRPDVRTYTLLLQGCVSAGQTGDAEGLLRAAVGLRGAHPRIARFGTHILQPRGGLPGTLVSKVVRDLSQLCPDRRVPAQLVADLEWVPGMHLDPQLKKQLAFTEHYGNCW
jgi:pentatricopeptide repeat protein